jgi:hypothetical protein
MSKKTLIGTLAGAVAIGGMILATAAPAEAQYRRGWAGHGGGWAGHGGGWGGHGGGWGGRNYGRGYPGVYHGRRSNAGGAIAAGIIGGLALGALAASATQSYGHGGYQQGYYAPPPRYHVRRTHYRAAPVGWSGHDDGWDQCRIVRRRVVDNWGYVRVRPVRICY